MSTTPARGASSPLILSATEPLSSAYSYSGNAPTVFADPSGLCRAAIGGFGIGSGQNCVQEGINAAAGVLPSSVNKVIGSIAHIINETMLFGGLSCAGAVLTNNNAGSICNAQLNRVTFGLSGDIEGCVTGAIGGRFLPVSRSSTP